MDKNIIKIMRQLLFFALFFVKTSVIAQDYTYSPMFEVGKVWKYDTTIMYPTADKTMEVNTFYTISVIDGPDDKGRFTLCKKYNDEGLGDEYLIPDSYYTMQESDRMVSYCQEKNVAWPLMDFNMKKDDKVQITEEGWATEDCGFITVMDDEPVTAKGRTYRRLKVTSGGADDYWVEGIGSKNGRFMTLIAKPGSWHIPGGKTYWVWDENLNSVYKDGECIFERTDFDTSGSLCGIEERGCNNPKVVMSIYDLQGRRLASAFPKGIYIKNGQKIVQK